MSVEGGREGSLQAITSSIYFNKSMRTETCMIHAGYVIKSFHHKVVEAVDAIFIMRKVYDITR